IDRRAGAAARTRRDIFPVTSSDAGARIRPRSTSGLRPEFVRGGEAMSRPAFRLLVAPVVVACVALLSAPGWPQSPAPQPPPAAPQQPSPPPAPPPPPTVKRIEASRHGKTASQQTLD